MDIHPTTATKGNGHHPLIIIAALAVVLFCLAGTAAIMGWIPTSIGGNAASRQLTEAERMALAANLPQGAQALQPLPAAQLAATQPPYATQPQSPTQAQYPAQQPVSQPYQGSAYAPQALAAPEPVRRAPVSKPVQVAAAEPARSNWCSNCGNIESIRTITTRAEGSGLGAAGGAVLGGLLGNQVGGGAGRQLATVAGAVGGAVVGNQVEGNMKATQSYEIRVRLDDGALRTFHQSSAPGWRNGDRVRIVKGHLRSVT